MEAILQAMEKASHTSDDRNQVLFWAAQLAGHTENRDAEHVARERGWLDQDGRVTESGEDLLAAFADQSGTVSARSICP